MAQGRVQSGYTIIQPRVSPSLPSTSGSPFSRLFSDPIGIDPYTNAVSDVYQDLTGEGSYHGKGIYDVRAFSRVLSGRFPEAWLLSHDLIEGAHVRVGLASDIELYDEFPQDYLSYIKRQHRWIRGDWQIADWIMPRVPQPGGGRGPNPLSWFDRWKIFDNLRRSLLPVASLALLMASWLISSRAGWIATVVVATQLFFHSLAQPFTWATTRQGLEGHLPRENGARSVAGYCRSGTASVPGLAGAGRHCAGPVPTPHLSSWVAGVDFGPGDARQCPGQSAQVSAFNGPGEPVQCDRGMGGAATGGQRTFGWPAPG